MKRKFASDPAEMGEVRAEIRRFLEGLPFDEEERYLLLLGIDEACTNIIRHAYDGRTDRWIKIELCALEEGFECRLRDYGRTTCETAFHRRPHNQDRPGGLGLHLMQRAFHEVRYVPCKRGTQLILVRRFGPTPVLEDSALRGRAR